MLGYIHDGYTIKAYLAAAPRLHPALRFEYRPMLVQNRAVVRDQIARSHDPRQGESIAAQAIKAQLVWWDLTKQVRGPVEPVAIEVSEILRLRPSLFLRLFQICVLGTEGGDEDPDLADDERDEAAQRMLAEALAGPGPQQREAQQEKNLPPG